MSELQTSHLLTLLGVLVFKQHGREAVVLTAADHAALESAIGAGGRLMVKIDESTSDVTVQVMQNDEAQAALAAFKTGAH